MHEQEIFAHLDKLKIGDHPLNKMVRKDNRKAFIEVCKKYMDTHPELYFNSTYTKLKKIDIIT